MRNRLTTLAKVDVLWQNFLGPEFGRKSHRGSTRIFSDTRILFQMQDKPTKNDHACAFFQPVRTNTGLRRTDRRTNAATANNALAADRNARRQVCAQLPTSAVKVALSASAAACRAAAPCCCGAGHTVRDRRANGTDRRTDSVSLHRPCSACYAGGASSGWKQNIRS